jgi:hypothetical protein
VEGWAAMSTMGWVECGLMVAFFLAGLVVGRLS